MSHFQHSQCTSNPPLADASYNGTGSVVNFGGLDAYVAGPSPSATVFALILLSDVFGFGAPKLRMIADKAAASGFYAAVPDVFHGHPYVRGMDLNVSDWKKMHPLDNMVKDTESFIKALKDKGVSRVGVAGFCYGGMTATKLATTDATKAVVLLHPSDITANNFTGVKVPIEVLTAEKDNGLPPALLKQFDDILSKNKVVHNITVFEGVGHGWTTRYNDTNMLEVESAMEAHRDMLAWFTKYVK